MSKDIGLKWRTQRNVPKTGRCILPSPEMVKNASRSRHTDEQTQTDRVPFNLLQSERPPSPSEVELPEGLKFRFLFRPSVHRIQTTRSSHCFVMATQAEGGGRGVTQQVVFFVTAAVWDIHI